MDGASKFVKGDAIAGIIITLINIAGGFLIGMAQMDMAASEALGRFTILTVGDGLVSQVPTLLVSTAAGSSAYNLSAQGPILPLGTEALALTPISPFRPRRWRGAVLPSTARIRFEILDYYKRPVAATADAQEIRNVISVDVYEEKDNALKLMFDPDHSLEQRILDEQFL